MSHLGQTQFHPLYLYIYISTKKIAYMLSLLSEPLFVGGSGGGFKSLYKWGAETIRIDFGFGSLKKKMDSIAMISKVCSHCHGNAIDGDENSWRCTIMIVAYS